MVLQTVCCVTDASSLLRIVWHQCHRCEESHLQPYLHRDLAVVPALACLQASQAYLLEPACHTSL